MDQWVKWVTNVGWSSGSRGHKTVAHGGHPFSVSCGGGLYELWSERERLIMRAAVTASYVYKRIELTRSI